MTLVTVIRPVRASYPRGDDRKNWCPPRAWYREGAPSRAARRRSPVKLAIKLDEALLIEIDRRLGAGVRQDAPAHRDEMRAKRDRRDFSGLRATQSLFDFGRVAVSGYPYALHVFDAVGKVVHRLGRRAAPETPDIDVMTTLSRSIHPEEANGARARSADVG